MTTIATQQAAARRLRSCGPWLPLLAWAALLATNAAAESPAGSGRTAAAKAKRPVVDSAVVPAGGAVHGHCGPGGCRHDHARHHRDCRNGVCAPYCPVRPSTFGFHGTQWRRWPGQAVVPVSNEQAVTPATPPRLEVPRANEESLGPNPADLPAPELEPAPEPNPDAAPTAVPEQRVLPDEPLAPEEPMAPAPSPVAPEPEAMPPEPAVEPEPTEPEPMTDDEGTPAEPRELPRGDAQPAPPAELTPPSESAPRPEDENLFDEAGARRVKRRIPVATAASRAVDVESDVQPTGHETGHENRFVPIAIDPATTPATPPAAAARRGWLAVPRVAFDPDAETARLESSKQQ
jgi:hypothetical protein